jgi:16S rRNA processing protein RimM
VTATSPSSLARGRPLAGPGARPDRILLGVVAGAHGLRGEVRIKSFTADPGDLGRYGRLTDEAGQGSFELRILRTNKEMVFARIAGIADRTAAESLRGLRLYVDRAVLPEAGPEEFYHADLVGLRVELANGAAFGAVKAVHNHGAGDILEITRPGGASEMLAFTRRTFPVVDLAGGRLVVAPPDSVVAGSGEAD